MKISDYDGFGIGSATQVAELQKALTAGYDYPPVDGGGALRVQSLENSLATLTYQEKHAVMWKAIPKNPVYSTVAEYTRLEEYGSNRGIGAFNEEGVLPEEEASQYSRQANFVKFLGVTKVVTHPMALVRAIPQDVIALESQNGIKWIMANINKALYFGNSKKGHIVNSQPSEWLEFDGLDNLIPDENTIDLKNEVITQDHIDLGSTIIADNYGIATDLFLGYRPYSSYVKLYHDKERIALPNGAGEIKVGNKITSIFTPASEVNVNVDVFLRKTLEEPTGATSDKAPTSPASITAGLLTGTDGDFAKSGAGDYTYSVTAVNKYGESAPVEIATPVTITSGDYTKHVPLTITNSATVTVPTEYFRIYRSEANGSTRYLIAEVPCADQSANGVTTWNDVNYRMPNTYTAFLGELTPEVWEFKQLLPLMKMDLATISPAYRFMLLLYGTPVLKAPKKWVKFINIKGDI